MKCEQCGEEAPKLIKFRSAKVCATCEIDLIQDEKDSRGRSYSANNPFERLDNDYYEMMEGLR